MKILHLSDTSLSGSPYRLSQLYNKHSKHESRQICWQRIIFNRVFPADMVGQSMSNDELYYWVHEWADVIHYHNRYKRQNIFKLIPVPQKKGVIQIHSPREEEGHQEELESGLPLAIIAQYHVRQWPELSYIVPNVVDIDDPLHKPIKKPTVGTIPRINYSPSSPNGRGWNNKSYDVVVPVLKQLERTGKVYFDRIIGATHEDCMLYKQSANIGIDEISTGSYHMASLEFLSQGVCCVGHIDEQCEKVIKDLTGCSELPWFQSSEKTFKSDIEGLIKSREYEQIGLNSRKWMEKYWNQKKLCSKYTKMYEDL